MTEPFRPVPRDPFEKPLQPLPIPAASARKVDHEPKSLVAEAGVGSDQRELATPGTHPGASRSPSSKRPAGQDALLVHSLGRLEHTLAGMDQSNRQAARSLELVGERLAHSGHFMNEVLAQMREAERDFAACLRRISRRSGVVMAGMSCMLLLSVLAVGFMFRENRRLLTEAAQKIPPVVQVQPPTLSRERIAIFEDQLDQVDDGIGEPDREIARRPEGPGSAQAEESTPAGTEPSSLLSVNRPPRPK